MSHTQLFINGLREKTVNAVNGIKSPYLADIIKTHKYTLVQNAELLDVKTGGIKSNHWSLKGRMKHMTISHVLQ